jgi:hypothetical protein
MKRRSTDSGSWQVPDACLIAASNMTYTI